MFSFAVYPKENGKPFLPRIKTKGECKGAHRQFFCLERSVSSTRIAVAAPCRA